MGAVVSVPRRGPMRNWANSTTAWRCVGEAMAAMETTGETWCEAEVSRVAGEIAFEIPGAGRQQAYFRRAARVAAGPATGEVWNCARR